MPHVGIGVPGDIATIQAQRWRMGGRVQGVGYRPYVYRLARSFDLAGWVRNSSGSVEIHAEGSPKHLDAFGRALLDRAPGAARARLIEFGRAVLEDRTGFVILASTAGGDRYVTVPWEVSTCEECLKELHDSSGRRHRYPFINCTQCGPRYSIMHALPYDRCNTTMDGFALCPACAAEYADPTDRRFHAQPLACAACGPTLRWQSEAGRSQGEPALTAAVAALRNGLIIAVRGVGGYHLLCDASNQQSVLRLRARKGRPAKPLAVMLPWVGLDGLDYARRVARLSPVEGATLSGAARPIVVAALLSSAALCSAVAPGLREVGLMLPYSPLHSLLLGDFGAAVVATSGNITGEPVLTSTEEAEERLSAIADGFLHHDRPIARPADDPVVRVIAGTLRPLRLGRGNAPVELDLAWPVAVPTLAVGAQAKCTIALAWGRRAVVSPHIGDLSTPRGRSVFAQVIADLQTLYAVSAERVAHDAHPLIASTRWARDSGLPALAVWHHHAHANAVVGEYSLEDPMMCFAWDGVGLGPDGTLWGGEALLGRPGAWRRAASFRPFPLLGGDRAAREPWRSALALSWDSEIEWPEGERRGGELLRQALDADLNSPLTTSVGRLFDAAASLTGICHESSYEGEAPRRLEALSDKAPPVVLPLVRDDSGVWRSDWRPLIVAMHDGGRSPEFRAAQFHASLAHTLRDQALAIRALSGVTRVGLAGGVFQNRILTEQVQALLLAEHFEVFIPERLPLNDAAISFGQLIEATASHAEG